MNSAPIRNAEIPTDSWLASNMENNSIIKFTDPLTKFGIVLAAVERMFVPNCSAAIVTKIAQYPVPVPKRKQKK
jgi:hypothetical protein